MKLSNENKAGIASLLISQVKKSYFPPHTHWNMKYVTFKSNGRCFRRGKLVGVMCKVCFADRTAFYIVQSVTIMLRWLKEVSATFCWKMLFCQYLSACKTGKNFKILQLAWVFFLFLCHPNKTISFKIKCIC